MYYLVLLLTSRVYCVAIGCSVSEVIVIAEYIESIQVML